METPREEEVRGERTERAGGDTLNGIDREALFEAIEDIKEDPAKGACSFFASTSWVGGTRSSCKISKYALGGEEIEQDYTITTDEPNGLLGTDTAPNPQMLIFAALNSCVLNTFVINAAAKNIPVDRVEVEVEGQLDLQGFLGIDTSKNPGYDEVTVVCRAEGSATREQYEDCLEAATRFSPNFQTFTRPVKVNYRLA